MSLPAGSPVIVTGTITQPGVDHRYVQSLKDRKASIEALCAGLYAYLSLGLDAAIEEASRKPPKPPRPTLEDLHAAQQELDIMQRQVAGLQEMAEHMPEELGRGFLDLQMPTIERLMQPARDRVSLIQQALEEPEDSEGPWDGSHRVGTLCAICARPFDGMAHSIPEIKVMLKDAGWGRDADGDHICPACVVKAHTSDARQAPGAASNTEAQ